jgi:tRNA U55 pseudouridine synthase TruB
LIDDIGEVLGCGAHVTALRRESIDGIHGDMVSLETLEAVLEGMGSELSLEKLPGWYSIEQVLPLPTFVLTDVMLEGLKIGILKDIKPRGIDSEALYLTDQHGTVYGFAQKDATGIYNITRRFVAGFGVSPA